MIYRTKGTCAQAIEFDIEDGILKDVKFIGGCQGNTQGVAALAKGQPVTELIDKLSGINCGFRGTSCPDQLANALKDYQANH
ncbi:MAG: TIGR03905 family TSCPD domain-containing protein [Lachnospiraceae bacterium]|nr:TIGR03905 family TSCPD domain-containing protein [Lachnospiraceae bacterium]